MSRDFEKFFMKVGDIHKLLLWAYNYNLIHEQNKKEFKYTRKLIDMDGVDKSVRVTSLNYAQDIQNAVEVVSNIPNIPTLTEIMESDNFRDVLETSAIIDINIKDTPFVGPKIRFDITQVPEFNSDIIEESTPEFSIDLEEEINNDKENKSCLE